MLGAAPLSGINIIWGSLCVYGGWLRANNHQKMGFFDFDHSEVEKASVKEVNGNRTAQAVMDWELKSKRRTSSGEKRTNVTQSSTKVELVHGHIQPWTSSTFVPWFTNLMSKMIKSFCISLGNSRGAISIQRATLQCVLGLIEGQ